MAALALVLAVIIGRIYRDHALNSEQMALAAQLHAISQSVQQRVEREATLLARALRYRQGRSIAADSQRPESLRLALEDVARFYDTVDPRPALIELGIYDAQANPLAQLDSGRSDDASVRKQACGYVGARLPHLSRNVLTRTSAGYCLAGGRAYYAVYVPIDDAATTYLGFVTDAAVDFATLESQLGLPIRVSTSGDAMIYESPGWQNGDSAAVSLLVNERIETPGGGAILVEAAKDESELLTRLDQTRYAVFFAAAAVTLLVVLVTLAFIEKVAIAPLRSLIDQLRNMQRDESQLGKRVAVNGNAEVQELANSFNDMTARLERLYENLDRMASTDSLTQLPNRGFLQDQLEQAAAEARVEGKAFALFVMDLDRFKEINDTLGHHIGDLLLQQVAIRLRSKLRESDVIARMGGDEFAVLMPNVTPKQTDMAARMLLQSLRVPFAIETQQLNVHTSIGICLYPDHGVDAQTLIQRADIAMYAAKQANCGHMFYDAQMDRHHPALLTLMGELRQAVEQEQFLLYFQPKIGLKTNRVVGFEALVRWRHPSGKLVLPDTFIPILEQTGLIRSLTGWVTNEALGMVSDLRERGFELPIAVNISTRDLLDSGLQEELAEQLAVHQASAHWLELEITESTVMADVAGAAELLTQLAGMGFRLIVDDFGTGYSSLAYLKRLPVHTVKIDKSFVMGMAKDENDAAIVYTSIDLAHNLGLQVVAEGVDQEVTLSRLRSRGCDEAQGIYLSRPLPREDVIEWLVKSSWGLRTEIAS
jgi:diguanylate cyclase (GGDEF)-like protein